MAKHNTNETNTTQPSSIETVTTVNTSITYRRDHPGNRCSFGIAGVPGIVVFDKGLFADPNNIPTTISLDIPLQLPRAVEKVSKDEQKAEKARLKAEKEAEKVKAAAEKAAAKQAKADAALAAAKAKADAAVAKLAAATKTPDAPEAQA
jgi:hypothetical protein